MAGLDIRLYHQQAARHILALRAQIAEIEQDADLNPEGKAKRIGPMQQALRAEIAKRDDDVRRQMAKAHAALEQNRPAIQHRRAALKDPAQAVAYAQLAAMVSDTELLALAQGAADPEKPNAALAYGVRIATEQRSASLSDAQRADVHRTLSTVTDGPVAAAALADFIIAKQELARWESFADPRDAVAEVTRHREARTIDLDGTGPRTLSDAEVAAAYDRRGITFTPPEVVPAKNPLANPLLDHYLAGAVADVGDD